MRFSLDSITTLFFELRFNHNFNKHYSINIKQTFLKISVFKSARIENWKDKLLAWLLSFLIHCNVSFFLHFSLDSITNSLNITVQILNKHVWKSFFSSSSELKTETTNCVSHFLCCQWFFVFISCLFFVFSSNYHQKNF